MAVRDGGDNLRAAEAVSPASGRPLTDRGGGRGGPLAPGQAPGSPGGGPVWGPRVLFAFVARRGRPGAPPESPRAPERQGRRPVSAPRGLCAPAGGRSCRPASAPGSALGCSPSRSSPLFFFFFFERSRLSLSLLLSRESFLLLLLFYFFIFSLFNGPMTARWSPHRSTARPGFRMQEKK